MDNRGTDDEENRGIRCHPQGFGSPRVGVQNGSKTPPHRRRPGAVQHKIEKFLEEQGIVKSTTAPNSSSSNVFVERRMGIVFSAARSALKAAPPPLNNNQYWSFAALDAIDKSNYLPLTRDDALTPSPNTQMQLHGYCIDEKDGPDNFLPFGQAGWIINTAKNKKQ